MSERSARKVEETCSKSRFGEEESLYGRRNRFSKPFWRGREFERSKKQVLKADLVEKRVCTVEETGSQSRFGGEESLYGRRDRFSKPLWWRKVLER